MGAPLAFSPGGWVCPSTVRSLGVEGGSHPEPLRGGRNASSTALLRHPADLAALLPDLSGRLLINSVFHVGAERLQQMLFSDSPFLQGFLQQCKFTGQGAEVVQARGGGGEEEAGDSGWLLCRCGALAGLEADSETGLALPLN